MYGGAWRFWLTARWLRCLIEEGWPGDWVHPCVIMKVFIRLQSLRDPAAMGLSYSCRPRSSIFRPTFCWHDHSLIHSPEFSLFRTIAIIIQACRSGSDPWLGPCMAITKLIQSSKAACNVVVKLPEFALPKPGTPEGEANYAHNTHTVHHMCWGLCRCSRWVCGTDSASCLLPRVMGGLL